MRRHTPRSRRASRQAELEARLGPGEVANPIHITSRTLATTFWGKAWCTHLETYSDYASRLGRGRSYARNGAVVHLAIREGWVVAFVQGSELYTVRVDVARLEPARWAAIRSACAGEVRTLLDLLDGKLSAGVMAVVCAPRTGMFPTSGEISMRCTCPDWASMCKHIAATLYGVGALLDRDPALLFRLRGVDPSELLELAIDQGVVPSARGRVLQSDDLASIFGVDIDFDFQVPVPPTLTERLVDHLAEHVALTSAALAEALGETRALVQRELVELEALGMVGQRGLGEQTEWRLT